MKWSHRALKCAVVASLFYTGIASSLESFGEPRTPGGGLDGFWEVDAAEPGGWRRVSINRYRMKIIQRDGTLVRYSIVDQDDKTITVARTESDQKVESTMSFAIQGEDDATLTGVLDGVAIRVSLTRIDTSKSLLMTRGFHWVSEEPFNR